jgi:hypothetical protein
MDNCAILATYDVGAAGGNREDLLDLITNISPSETPFLSGLRKTTCAATLHEWLLDTLASPGDPDVGDADVHCTPEASDADFSDLPIRCRINNMTHIFRQTYDVSDTQRAVKVAGISDEFAYQASKALKQLALTIEFALIHSHRAAQFHDQHPGDCQSPSGCRKMDGLLAFTALDSRDFDCLADEMQGEVLDPAGSPYTELTADLLDDLSELMWQKGANPKNVWVNAYQKRKISGFCIGCQTKTVAAADKKLVNSVDVYESDFGLRRINLHRYIPTRTLLQTDDDYLAIAFLRAIKSEILARVGNSTKGMVEGELTLEVRAPASLGEIINLTNDPSEE